MYDWVVVGGGIHGTTVATFLLQAAGISRERLLIVDPNRRLIQNWEHRAAAVGMKTLRSSMVHHLDVDPFSLKKFADSREGRTLGKLRGRFGHPDNRLFEAHCRRVLETLELSSLHTQDTLYGIELAKDDSLLSLRLERGSLRTRNVVLALGNPSPLFPSWVKEFSEQGKMVVHGLELAENLDFLRAKKVAIVGGGLTAAQVALRVRQIEVKEVTVFSRHPLRKFQFDCEPGWIGPKYRAGFEKLTCPRKKREVIGKARRRGTITPDVWRLFGRHLRDGSISFSVTEEALMSPSNDCVRNGGSFPRSLEQFDAIILATGFEQKTPSSELVNDIASSLDLALTPCGVPFLTDSVHWGKGVFVSGALAEMRIGPFARNIPGARSAALEISNEAQRHSLRASLSPPSKDDKFRFDLNLSAH